MRRRRLQQCGGYTLIELLTVVIIVCLASALAIQFYERARRERLASSLKTDCERLRRSLMSYRSLHGKFPSETEFDTRTLAPLSTEGHLEAAATLTNRLRDQRLLVYLAPDVDGTDTEFLVVAQDEFDPSVLFAIAHTGVVGESGRWMSRIYEITRHGLEDATHAAGAGSVGPRVESAPTR